MSTKTKREPLLVQGFVVTPGYLTNKQVLENWEVYDEDIWIAGAPKSGTTWTQEMVWLIANDLDYAGAKRPIQERTPHWEDSSLMDIRWAGIERNVEIPLFRADSLRFIRESKEPNKTMCVKSHMPFDFLPKQIRDGTKKPKIVFVTRNVKDVCVSLYYYLKNLIGLEKSMEEFAGDFLDDGKVIYGPFWDVVISYWKQRQRPNLLLLSYEELVSDIRSAIRKVANFLGKNLTVEQIEELAEHLSFAKMKNNPAVNFKNLFELYHKLGFNSGKGEFLRSGTVGSHKEDLSEEMIKRFDAVSASKTRESGFSFK